MRLFCFCLFVLLVRWLFHTDGCRDDQAGLANKAKHFLAGREGRGGGVERMDFRGTKSLFLSVFCYGVAVKDRCFGRMQHRCFRPDVSETMALLVVEERYGVSWQVHLLRWREFCRAAPRRVWCGAVTA